MKIKTLYLALLKTKENHVTTEFHITTFLFSKKCLQSEASRHINISPKKNYVLCHTPHISRINGNL